MKFVKQTLTKDVYKMVESEVVEMTTLQAKKFGEENGYERLSPTNYIKRDKDYNYKLTAMR